MTTNTIFSVGALDPWGGAGITSGGDDADDRGVYFFTMDGAAHHLDLRGSRNEDPEDVKKARKAEEEIIVGWIKDWFEL